ncbi:MAG: hypothetical protein ACLS4Z_07590 [Christensenellaceae bacterium]
MRGRKIEGDREDAPELEEGRYYIADLLGAAVVTESGELLGTVRISRRSPPKSIRWKRTESKFCFPR